MPRSLTKPQIVTLFDLARLSASLRNKSYKRLESRTVARKASIRGRYVCVGRLYVYVGRLTFKFGKNST